VSAMTGEFDPGQYKDEYREALETIIQAKVEGKETVAVEAPEESGKLIDLMAALEASVSAAKAARDGSSEKPVSVADAKAARAAGAKTTKAKTTAKAKADADADEAEAPAKPARKRKTA
jgi:DNA end-binding protein Ku